jgi:hypothetical protein
LPTADGTNGQYLQTNGAGQLAFAGISSPLAVIGNATAGAEIRLPEDTDNGINYVALKAPNALASNLTFTLPSADGTNGQVLQTDGSGSLSFATISSGMSLVETKNATGTEVVFTGLTGSRYLIIFNNVTASGGTSAFTIQWGYGSGPTYQASGYNYQYQQLSGTTFNNYGWYSNGDGRIVAFNYSVSSPVSAAVFMTGVGTTRPSTFALAQDTNNYMTLLTTTNVSAGGNVNSFRIYGATFSGGSISLYALA